MKGVLPTITKGQSEIPDVQEFCVSIPLYKEYDISKCTQQQILLEFEYFQGAVDAYCLDCARDGVFKAHIIDLRSYDSSVNSPVAFLRRLA